METCWRCPAYREDFLGEAEPNQNGREENRNEGEEKVEGDKEQGREKGVWE